MIKATRSSLYTIGRRSQSYSSAPVATGGKAEPPRLEHETGALGRSRGGARSTAHEALADVHDGRVIDHQAVQAWADSLSADQPLPVPTAQVAFMARR